MRREVYFTVEALRFWSFVCIYAVRRFSVSCFPSKVIRRYVCFPPVLICVRVEGLVHFRVQVCRFVDVVFHVRSVRADVVRPAFGVARAYRAAPLLRRSSCEAHAASSWIFRRLRVALYGYRRSATSVMLRMSSTFRMAHCEFRL